MTDLLLWFFVGGVAGWCANLLGRKAEFRQSLLMDVTVGAAGAVFGGWLMSSRFGVPHIRQDLFSFGSVLVAVVAAVILLIVMNMVRRGHSR